MEENSTTVYSAIINFFDEIFSRLLTTYTHTHTHTHI